MTGATRKPGLAWNWAVACTPHTRVVTFLTDHDDLWLSSIVIHELEYELQRMAQGQRRSSLQDRLQGLITEYEDRILPVERVGGTRNVRDFDGLEVDLVNPWESR